MEEKETEMQRELESMRDKEMWEKEKKKMYWYNFCGEFLSHFGRVIFIQAMWEEEEQKYKSGNFTREEVINDFEEKIKDYNIPGMIESWENYLN